MMTNKELFEKCIVEAGFSKPKKALDTKKKKMIVHLNHPEMGEDWFSLIYSFKGDKPTPQEAEEMYTSLITIFVKKQLMSYSKFSCLLNEGEVIALEDGVEKIP